MTKNFNSIARALALGGLLWTIGPVGAFQQGQQAPDNTKVNKRDRSAAQPTADQAKETVSDRDIMRQIRKALVADKTLSTYGKNVKVISQHGKVTLKGPVRSEDESKSIEVKAVEVAGAGNVTNQLAVKVDKNK